MDFKYGGCLVHITAGLDDGTIVAQARIEVAPGSVSSSDDTHDMEFHSDFVDEHEAIEFARERAMAWIDEHVERVEPDAPADGYGGAIN
jgi:folate-dependent phosphoribosylglycinamide formyltransferase PurN